MSNEKVKKSDFIESIDANSNDGTTFKFYNYQTLARFGETELGIQEPGESHDAYKTKVKNGNGITTIVPSVWG